MLVSDSLITLCNAYCEYAGRAIGVTTSGGLLRLLYSALRTRWTGALGEDPRLLAGILRYHNVNQRVYGVAAILNFTPSADDHIGSALRDAVLEFGLRFIVGHEAAHHVLEHKSPSVFLTPDESTSPTSESEQRELDADTLALFAAAEAFARYEATHMGWLPERWRREAAEFHGLIGALITMLALQTSERALFRRPGRTHLPTAARAMHLINHVLSPARQASLSHILGRRDPRLDLRFEKDRGNLSVYLRNLAIATELASAFGEGTEEFDWDAITVSGEIEKPLDGHLERVATLDRLMCSPDTVLADKIGEQLNSEGTRLIMVGDTLNELLGWGLRPDRVETMNDPSRVLAFHTVVETSKRSFLPRPTCSAHM